MKKIILSCLFLFLSIVVFPQDENLENPKYEIKANAFNLIVFKAPEVAFEYLINEDSSVGASILVNVENPENENSSGPYYNELFAFTPYYRRYFSAKYAERFFLETFAMLNKQESFYEYIDFPPETNPTSTNLAFGIVLGSKFTSPGGFMFEFYGGIGRNIFFSNREGAEEFVPRLGVSAGYRF